MTKLYVVPITNDGSFGRLKLFNHTNYATDFKENRGSRLIIQIDDDTVRFMARFRGNEVLWEIDTPSVAAYFYIGYDKRTEYDEFSQWLLNNYPADHTFLMFNLDILSGRFSPGEDCEEVVLQD